MNFDLAIIGGGPGGYVAAIRAGQLGMKVALIERDDLGGVCLNWGCIPTKALLNAAHSYQHIRNKVKNFGINIKEVSFDLTKIVEYSRKKSKKLSSGVDYLMKKNKVALYRGNAVINSDKTITIDAKGKIISKNIIVATGARSRQITQLESDGKVIWDYRNAMIPDTLPKSLIVVGSGAIGMEFASFYNALGVELSVIEVLPQILPAEDKEIACIVQKEFERRGVKFYLDSKITSVKKEKAKIFIKIGDNEISAENLVVAAGVIGNSDGLGLEKFAKIKIEKSYIQIDGYCYTGESGIYAIGDVAGPPCLAHKASSEGVLCVEKIFGINGLKPIDSSNIPSCTYCNPQVASVGLTEEQARKAGYSIKVGKFRPEGNGKAVVLEENFGLVKIIFDKKTGELLGAHMVGAEVTELIQGYVIGKKLEATDQDFKHIIFPHPTLSEMMYEAVLDADGGAMHS